jgi:hypothetical protein
MLYAAKQSNTTYRGNHFVVLRSPIVDDGRTVRLTVFTWGEGERQIPEGAPLSESDFLGNVYGYVVAKPY